MDYTQFRFTVLFLDAFANHEIEGQLFSEMDYEAQFDLINEHFEGFANNDPSIEDIGVYILSIKKI